MGRLFSRTGVFVIKLLCVLGLVTPPLWVSVSSFIKWENPLIFFQGFNYSCSIIAVYNLPGRNNSLLPFLRWNAPFTLWSFSWMCIWRWHLPPLKLSSMYHLCHILVILKNITGAVDSSSRLTENRASEFRYNLKNLEMSELRACDPFHGRHQHQSYRSFNAYYRPSTLHILPPAILKTIFWG